MAVYDKIARNAKEFNKQLVALSVAIDADLEKVIRLAVLKLFNRIVEMSPVDTGAYRVSHGITTGEPSDTEGIVSGEQTGEMTWNEGLAIAGKEIGGWRWKMGDGVIYIFNNQPYAERIEEGHSGQAPKGVYTVALEQFAVEWKKALAEINSPLLKG